MSLNWGNLSYAQYIFPLGLPRTPPGHSPLIYPALYSVLTHTWRRTSFKVSPILIDWLLQKGANPNERNTTGTSALGHLLMLYRPENWSQFYEMSEILFRGGANANMSLNADDKQPISALRFAMTKSDRLEHCEEIVRMLLKHKADPNHIDTEGYRPLYYAIRLQYGKRLAYRKAADCVLQYGANPSDLGNGINALQPETFQHDRPFSEGAMQIQALLREYSTVSEGDSRRNSVVAEDQDDLCGAEKS